MCRFQLTSEFATDGRAHPLTFDCHNIRAGSSCRNWNPTAGRQIEPVTNWAAVPTSIDDPGHKQTWVDTSGHE